jgi:hypothetical protein
MMELPKNWHSLKVGQLIEFEQLRRRTDLEELDQVLQLLNIVTAVPVEAFEAMPYSDVIALYSRLGWMADLPLPKKPAKRVKLAGKTYRFQSNPAAIPAHLFATVQTLSAEGAMMDNLHKIIAALLIEQRMTVTGYRDCPPVGKAEAAEAWEKLSEAVRDEMPAAIAYGYALFFSALLPKLLEGSLTYFQNQAKKLSKAAKRAAGSKSSSTSQTKTRRK